MHPRPVPLPEESAGARHVADSPEKLGLDQRRQGGAHRRPLRQAEQAPHLGAVDQRPGSQQCRTARCDRRARFDQVAPPSPAGPRRRGRGRDRERRLPLAAVTRQLEQALFPSRRRGDFELEQRGDPTTFRARHDGSPSEPLQPGSRRQLRASRTEPQGVARGELAGERMRSTESPPGRFVSYEKLGGRPVRCRRSGGEVVPQARKGADLRQRALLFGRARGPGELDELIANALARDVPEAGRGGARGARGGGLDLEAAEAHGETRQSEDAERVGREGGKAHGAQTARREIGQPAVWIQDAAAREVERQGVHREVAPREVVGEIAPFEIPEVDLELGRGDPQRREATRREPDRSSSEGGGEAVGDLLTVASDHRVEVADRPAERCVARRSADQQDPLGRGRQQERSRRGMIRQRANTLARDGGSERSGAGRHLLGSRALSMSLDVREVHRIAALARLRLSPDEERLFAAQLGRVIEHIDQIRALATADAPHGSPAAAPEAADEPAPGLERQRFLANAPAANGPFLAVPKVLGTGDG